MNYHLDPHGGELLQQFRESLPLLQRIQQIAYLTLSQTLEEQGLYVTNIEYRIKDENGRAVADMLAIKGEKVDMSVEGGYRFVDPEQPWKSTHIFENCTAELLQQPLIRGGKPVKRFTSPVRHFMEVLHCASPLPDDGMNYSRQMTD